jgi:hypothetical protein
MAIGGCGSNSLSLGDRESPSSQDGGNNSGSTTAADTAGGTAGSGTTGAGASGSGASGSGTTGIGTTGSTGSTDGAVGSGTTGAAPAACSPLDQKSVPTELTNVVGIGKHADGTIYAIDQSPNQNVGYRVFASLGSNLIRQPIAGSGQSSAGGPSSSLVFTVSDSYLPFTLKADLSGQTATAMGVIRGSTTGRDFTIGAEGDVLQLVGTDALQGFTVSDPLQYLISLYYATLDDGSAVVVLRPAFDWTYSDFRVFYGTPANMEERRVTSAEATLSGVAYIEFSLDGVTAMAVFGSPQLSNVSSSLTIGGGPMQPLNVQSSVPTSLSYYCL